MNIETVNELIAALESAGELSIREQKFLKLAKAFKQLAAENVALKEEISNITFMRDDDFFGSTRRAQEVMGRLVNVKTTATDRIVAGIKADGVEEFAAYQRAITEEWACKEGHSSLLKVAESAEIFAKQLREGAK
ncbi:TPA: hypothetical protein NBI39_001117 [Klebsiella pneumoniae]|nr:hypothetical protein [Klebsiella pneumoniae]